MKVSVLTLGCKANQAESLTIETGLRTHGFRVVELSEKPELCIINTCSVTSRSDYQSRQLIRKARRAGAKVIVTGCYSELNRDYVQGMDGVAKVLNNTNKFSIINELTGKTEDNPLSFEHLNKARLFLKVQDGCNYSCSYCIIPRARGRSRSVAAGAIIDQINAASGIYNEVVLTGIHLGLYGYDLRPRARLSNLLKTILSKTAIKRIRLSSLGITEISDDLLDIIMDDRVCKHLHIPLQSGDDRILRFMNRAYSSGVFLKGIERIYSRIPDISIGTDVIVGFPGEGEVEFNNTKRLLEMTPFSYLHIFPFSPRPGTVASKMRMGGNPRTRNQRCAVLRELGMLKKEDFMRRQIGKTLDLLIERRIDNGCCLGTTGNYLKVKAMIPHAAVRDIVHVRINDYQSGLLIGNPIQPT